jgi:general stress protein CsbA
MTAAAIAASSARDVGYTHAFWVYIVGNISVGVAYT